MQKEQKGLGGRLEVIKKVSKKGDKVGRCRYPEG